MLNFEEIRPGIRNMLKVNMNLKKGESVLILNDVQDLKEWHLSYDVVRDFALRSLMARKFFDLAREEFKENHFDYMVYTSVGQHGNEPPEEVAVKLPEYDVVIALNTYSISHTKAREEAVKKGTRIASMPGIEPGMLMKDGPIAVDYNAVCKDAERIADMLTQTNSVRVVTDLGTDLSFSVKNRKGGADTGLITKKGEWGNLPGGEAYIAPVEGSANGRVVVPSGWYFNLKEDMELEFRDGYVISVKGGGEVGEHFRELFAFDDETAKHRRNCAELGIGTNPKAKRPDNVLEAEKIKGTVHIAIGDSSHLGGVTESDLHEDFVLPEPTLYLDERIVIKKGKLITG